jgi:hypothetical protein
MMPVPPLPSTTLNEPSKVSILELYSGYAYFTSDLASIG